MKPKTTSITWTIALAAVLSLIAALPSTAATTLTRDHPITYYVNENATGANNGTSWQDAFTDLQSALSVAVAGDDIWVAAGTYKPNLSIDPQSSDSRLAAFSLISGVGIYGGFEGNEHNLNQRHLDDTTVTVLSGDIGIEGDDTDNSYHVVYADGVTDAVLDGFTVTGGRGDVYGRDSKGAGMYNYNSALTVSNCTFSDNRVAVRTNGLNGAGAGMYNYNSAPIVSNCIFSANQAGNASIIAMGFGGGMYNEGFFDTGVELRSPLVTGCTFTGNVAYASYDFREGGGGMYNNRSKPTVNSCTFVGNSAGNGGAMLNFSAAPTVTNCIFEANFTTYPEGRGGAIVNVGGEPIILNCTFYKNGWRLMPENYQPRFRPYTSMGGAIYEDLAHSSITNVIFIENAVRAYGAGIVTSSNFRYAAELSNCIFYENISWQPGYEGPEISHVDGDPTESSNLYDIDPLLVDPAGGDFHLRYDSPCIDAGVYMKQGNYYWPVLLTTDFYGDKRIIDGDGRNGRAIDIGAAEYVPTLPDLQDFVQGLADAGQINATLADRLLAYIDAAQAALQQSQPTTAANILQSLIADVKASPGDTQTALAIEAKAVAVIENLD